MQITHLLAVLFQILRQVFRHTLGERGHQHTLVDGGTLADLREQIVHLGRHRTHFDNRIQQPGRTNHLINHLIARFLQLVVARRGRHVDSLRRQRLKLFKLHRTVIQCRRQTEPVLHQRLFTRAVTAVHPAYLRNGDVGFVYHQQAVGREVVKQRRRRLTRPTT